MYAWVAMLVQISVLQAICIGSVSISVNLILAALYFSVTHFAICIAEGTL